MPSPDVSPLDRGGAECHRKGETTAYEAKENAILLPLPYVRSQRKPESITTSVLFRIGWLR